MATYNIYNPARFKWLLVQQNCNYCPIALDALIDVRARFPIKSERDVRIINSNLNRGEYVKAIETLRASHLLDGSPMPIDLITTFPLLVYDGTIKSGITNRLAYEKCLAQLMVA